MVAALAIYILGAALLRKFKVSPPTEPDPAELRKVDVRYRCSVCGSEVTMTTAAGDDPDAPRHCREDMVLVSGAEGPA